MDLLTDCNVRLTQRILRIPLGHDVVVPASFENWIVTDIGVVPGNAYVPPVRPRQVGDQGYWPNRYKYQGEVALRFVLSTKDGGPMPQPREEFRGSLMAMMDDFHGRSLRPRPLQLRDAGHWLAVAECIGKITAMKPSEAELAEPESAHNCLGPANESETDRRLRRLWRSYERRFDLVQQLLQGASAEGIPQLLKHPMAFGPGDTFGLHRVPTRSQESAPSAGGPFRTVEQHEEEVLMPLDEQIECQFEIVEITTLCDDPPHREG